jgi:hypothetical protein
MGTMRSVQWLYQHKYSYIRVFTCGLQIVGRSTSAAEVEGSEKQEASYFVILPLNFSLIGLQ